MASKNKLKRYKENETFPNVFQPTREQAIENALELKGNWKERIFKNDHPLVLELGCGRGEYAVGLGQRNPHKNYLGVDNRGARFWYGAKESLELGLKNVCFLRTRIELIDTLFAPNEVDEIWITFPDPQTKYQRTKHRLTNPDFLNKYKQILKPGGLVHLKTDSEYLYGYTSGLLTGAGVSIDYAHNDVYKNKYSPEEVVGIQTYYEKIYLEKNKKITYLRFKLDDWNR